MTRFTSSRQKLERARTGERSQVSFAVRRKRPRSIRERVRLSCAAEWKRALYTHTKTRQKKLAWWQRIKSTRCNTRARENNTTRLLFPGRRCAAAARIKSIRVASSASITFDWFPEDACITDVAADARTTSTRVPQRTNSITNGHSPLFPPVIVSWSIEKRTLFEMLMQSCKHCLNRNVSSWSTSWNVMKNSPSDVLCKSSD